MKNLLIYKKAWIMALALLVGASAHAFTGEDDELNDTINFKAFYGKIVDASSGRMLPFATIEAVGSNIATVSNIDGEFTLKIARETDISEMKISYIGFKNKTIPLIEFKNNRSPDHKTGCKLGSAPGDHHQARGCRRTYHECSSRDQKQLQ